MSRHERREAMGCLVLTGHALPHFLGPWPLARMSQMGDGVSCGGNRKGDGSLCHPSDLACSRAEL